MTEGIGLIVLGLTIVGCAMFRWYDPSWGSAWRYGAAGLGFVVVGLAFIAFDAFLDHMRYRLRTLLIVLALGPPVLAGLIWLAMTARQAKELDHLLLHYGEGALIDDE